MKIVKFYVPVTKSEEKNGKVLIQGEASDTGEDYDEQRCSEKFIHQMVDTVNSSQGGIGCYPDHDFRASNLAARHYEAEVIDKKGDKGFLIRSELNPAHSNFEYWKYVFLNKYPIQYSITVINPVITEEKSGNEIIDGGDLKTVDFVAIGANPRTWISLQKGGFEVIEEELGKMYPEIYSEEDENMAEKKEEKTVNDTANEVLEAVQKLAELSAEEIEKEGRTLNAANKQKLEQAVKLIKAVLGDTESSEEKSAEEKVEAMAKKILEMSKKIADLEKESNGRSSGMPEDPLQKEFQELDKETKENAEWGAAIFADIIRAKGGGG